MSFVELTQRNNSPIVINMAHVTEMFSCPNEPTNTIIMFTDAKHGTTTVKESLIKISKLVKGDKKK